ncbi:MAG: double-strand break repair helicase AddA [Rickettsiales bacterium]|jgi:ATP-dependent helicase/nuclease subunit A|nr:double-strand break repair helicase AddA [Rickettsiales bacterium]
MQSDLAKKPPFGAPDASVFVSANAGSGKTTLLTNRVLSLLCHGVRPERILCLTYTNAAAAEMKSRIIAALGGWVMKDDAALQATLEDLLGVQQNTQKLSMARALFANVLDAPEGLRIHTLHGFCQSLLKRFPLEAKVSPHFEIIESATQKALLSESLQRLYQDAGGDNKLAAALTTLVNHCTEQQLRTLLQEIINHKRKFGSLLQDSGLAEKKLLEKLGLHNLLGVQHLVQEYFDYSSYEKQQLSQIALALSASPSKNDQKYAARISSWLSSTLDNWHQSYDDYRATFFKADDTLREVLFTKNALTDAALIEAFVAEQERVSRFDESYKSQKLAVLSTAMLTIATNLLRHYHQLKSWRSALDYDDLIDHSCAMLDGAQMVPWVLFKLDGGIDHLMIDEAQDTSPQQWHIVSKLSEEFFSGQGRSDQERSLFIVGDEKQSIFSFQGADVTALLTMQNFFSKRIADAGKPIVHMALEHSYRSTPQVLEFVDSVFSHPSTRQGVITGERLLHHSPKRVDASGFVMQWPLTRVEENSYQSSASLLARQIADQIKSWLSQGLWLESKKRAAQPSDIMILVRQRTGLVDHLVRALKRAHIPVAGTDRMQLLDNLVVQDLLALGRFALLPEDDLNLAALLKSPLCNLSEDELLTLCWDRGKQSIWQRLQEFKHQEPYQSVYALLYELRARVDYISPYAWYSDALEAHRGRIKILGRMGQEHADVIDEFLDQALIYEREQTSSMQGFLHWLEISKGEIKRDMEQGHDVVRILTVHAAKGLQAPLVIIPDTVEAPKTNQKEHLLWCDAIPILALASADDNELCRQIRNQKKQDAYAEYRRLLYVALTRAEDHLLICGHTGRKEISEESWYHHTRSAIEKIAHPVDTPPGVGYLYGQVMLSEPAIKRDNKIMPQDEPGFLRSPVPEETATIRPLMPSRLADHEPAAASPSIDPKRAARGHLIHNLLQRLTALDRMHWQMAADQIAAGFDNLSHDERAQAIAEATHVLQHPDWSFIFGEESIAEASIVGHVLLAGKTIAVAGRMDRLVLSQQEIWLVDYKTSLNPAKTVAEVPRAYLRQLFLYKSLLKQLYPDKKVRCALLWTSVPKMMPIDEALLDETLLSSYI